MLAAAWTLPDSTWWTWPTKPPATTTPLQCQGLSDAPTGSRRLWPGRELVRTPPDGMSTYNQCLGNRAVSIGLLTGPWDLNLAKGRGPGFESFARSRFSKSATRARCVSGLFRCFRDTIAPVHLGPKYPLGRLHHFPSGKSPRPPIAASRRFFSNRAASAGRVARFSPALDVVAFDGPVQVRADQKPSLETENRQQAQPNGCTGE